jgi:DNA polymerase-1
LVERQKEVFESIEMPLLPVLSQMETLGVLIDKAVLLAHGERLKIRMAALENEAFTLAGQAFNLSSPKQLQEILYTQLKLPVLAKTPTGQVSTAEPVLQELAYDYRLPAVILEYRSLSKLVSTYIDALPKKIHAKTGRVHTSYNQAVTATGRLSSSDPNLQNIPARTEEGRLIRTAFIAPPNEVIIAADYSQIELRIMAHLSGDENLWRAFQNGWDIHRATAAEIFDLPLDDVTHEQRRRAKAVNFGLIYGMSAFGLSKQIGVTRQEAEFYIEMYFKRYPGVLAYMERTRQFAHEKGYVETLFGRRLYLPEINVKNIARRKAAERMAINAPMQGTAADIIKKAMIAISHWQNSTQNPPAKLIMQVHDELVFEVQKDKVDEARGHIQNLMEHTVELAVPLTVSVGVGANWDEAH